MLDLALMMLPGRLHLLVRRLRGQQVARSARIGFGVLLQVGDLEIGDEARIGSFARVRARRAVIGPRSVIGSITTISVATLILGNDAEISSLNVISGAVDQDRSILELGAHSRIFPMCWLEPGHGIHIGNRVGVGGRSLIFTHGSWANYFRGAPVAFGPVHIEDRVWLPWRVFILPGVTIGADAILGAGSVVTKSIPARSLAGGVPASVRRDDAHAELDDAQASQRIHEAIDRFVAEKGIDRSTVAVHGSDQVRSGSTLVLVGAGLTEADVSAALAQGVGVLDVSSETMWTGSQADATSRLGSWLSTYGVRFDRPTAPKPELRRRS